MNLSLKNRVQTSFGLAVCVIILLAFIVFHHLNSLNKQIKLVTTKSNQVSLLTDEIRISAISILKYQRKILLKKPTPELIEKILNLCESFTILLQRLDSLYIEPEIKKIVGKMLSYVDSLKLILQKVSNFHRDNLGMRSVEELADKILETFSEFQDIQFYQNIERDKKIKQITNDTKKKMMLILIIAFLWTIILGLIIPGKIALPFKKIKDAIRELQDCNFDVSIYYSEDDEIGEIAQEMNKMINSFKIFEELRAGKIIIENRKFDVLANMIKKPVLLSNTKGELIYLNNRVYSLLHIQSEDCIGRPMVETVIPPCIIQTFDLAIKRRSKIEDSEIIILKKEQKNTEEKTNKIITIQENEKKPKTKKDEEKKPEYIYKGLATVIPIRGKESSLDYYLMTISEEIKPASNN